MPGYNQKRELFDVLLTLSSLILFTRSLAGVRRRIHSRNIVNRFVS